MLFFFAMLMGADELPVDEEQVQRWVRAARIGNRAAAQQLYTHHVARLFRVVRPLLQSDAEAQDVVQDGFVDALGNLARYSPRQGKRFLGWLTTLALNRARKQRSRWRTPDGREASNEEERGTDSTQTEQGVRRRELLEALATLPERDRQVICLRYGADFSADEVADVLKLSPANVRKICQRQRPYLLQKLDPAWASSVGVEQVSR